MTNKNTHIKQIKLTQKIIKECNDNIVRKLLFWLKPYFNYFIGNYYTVIHNLLIISVTSILLFSNNINYLCAILIIMTLIWIVNVMLHNCPLTHLERKYLGKSNREHIKKIVHKLGIHYRANEIYEFQLEIITNVTGFIAFKIMGIIILKILNIKVNSE